MSGQWTHLLHQACAVLGWCNNKCALMGTHVQSGKFEMPLKSLSLATNVGKGWSAYSRPMYLIWCNFDTSSAHAFSRLKSMSGRIWQIRSSDFSEVRSNTEPNQERGVIVCKPEAMHTNWIIAYACITHWIAKLMWLYSKMISAGILNILIKSFPLPATPLSMPSKMKLCV